LFIIYENNSRFIPTNQFDMNLKITTKCTRTLSDGCGNKLFKFPTKTLLDNIIIDLWNDIMKYTKPPFILCNRLIPCSGYRNVTKDEFPLLKSDFLNYYRENEGFNNYNKIKYSQEMYANIH
jgi:hypothetical protein